jgi:hypothetical protein
MRGFMATPFGKTMLQSWDEFNSVLNSPGTLFQRAQDQYPFIRSNNVNLTISPRDNEGFAETWPAGETGTLDRPRPLNFPMNSTGIEVFKPNQFTTSDVAGEVMHVDPIVNKTRDEFIGTLNPKQLAIVKSQPDYQMSLRMGMSEEGALQNAADAVMRGYVVGQWPEEALKEFGFNIKQNKLLSDLKNYTTTGKK